MTKTHWRYNELNVPNSMGRLAQPQRTLQWVFYPYIHWGFGAFKPFILLALLRTICFSDELQPKHGVT